MKAPETFDEYLSLTEVKVMQRNGTVDRMAFPEYEEMMRRRINRYGSTSVEDRYETVAGRLMPVLRMKHTTWQGNLRITESIWPENTRNSCRKPDRKQMQVSRRPLRKLQCSVCLQRLRTAQMALLQ